LADFGKHSLVDRYIPVVYEKEICVPLNFVDEKLRLAGCISAEGDAEKEAFVRIFIFILVKKYIVGKKTKEATNMMSKNRVNFFIKSQQDWLCHLKQKYFS
jgi:hypothetical protein